MAFLDNSGDIILDAVLTETGRRRLAKGNFKVKKYAFGDDEINYELYKIDHASGSAYVDLEILQTPILEAMTEVNLINGLLSLSPNVLYMPDVVFNEKLSDATSMKNDVINIAVNSETWDAMNTGWGSAVSQLAAQTSGGSVIIAESGINNSDVSATPFDQNSYITSLNMLDTSVSVTFNRKFIGYIFGSDISWIPTVLADGSWGTPAPTLTSYTTVFPSDRDGWSSTNVPMSKATVFNPPTSTLDVSTYVNTAGVIGSMVALNIAVKPSMTTTMTQTAAAEWARFGTTGASVAGLTGTYGYITTSLELQCNASGASVTLPITLYRRES
jgi:hypothetical protein